MVVQAKSTGQIRAELWLQRDVTGRQETLQACILLTMTCRNFRAWRRVLAVLGLCCRPLLMTVVAFTPGSWPGASWGPGTT